MKVLHLITKLEFGGAQQNTLYTVNHLNGENFEVILASGKDGYLDKTIPNLSPNVQIVWLKFLKRDINPFWDFLAFWELVFWLKRLKPQIIHTHSSKAGIVGRWAAFLARVPVIIHTFHGFGFNDFQPKLLKKLLVFIEKRAAKITTQFIFVAKENETQARALGLTAKKEPALIRSGVDLERIDRLEEVTREVKRKELYINLDQILVVTVANLKKQKNPKHFVELARRLERRFPKATFLFIGGGENEEIFYDAPENVRYLGWREDGLAILKASDIFVLTSLWEGLPRAAVEALRLGLPVCAYATDGLKEIVNSGYNGALVRPGDLVGLAQAIEQLLRDPAKRLELAKNARASISEEFDINLMVKEQENLYMRLLRPTSSASQ